MAENSKIQWTHHTFNPWRGCARVSPGCVHCYAETLSKRNPKTLGEWGVDGTRVIAADAMWRQPLKWNKAAQQAGERHRVFCASLADVGEDRTDLVEPRARLCQIIEVTPHLDWLLLTKRPENMARLFPESVLKQCWIGTTCENQEYADQRIPILVGIPAKVRFISVEPQIGPVSFRWMAAWPENAPTTATHPSGTTSHLDGLRRLDWVIVGGESGGGARPFDLKWARDIIGQCAEAKTACFVKQIGARPVDNGGRPLLRSKGGSWHYKDRAVDSHGGDITEWPDEIRVRQFPEVA